MKPKIIHRIFAAATFLITLFVYLITVQSTVSFWDCGEFIASAYKLQVPHPPGTPFFLILGRLFSMIPFAENIGMRVNMISVFSSAFTVMFLYLVAVKVIENFRNKESESFGEKLITYIASSIGALSLAFSDTFWFNGTEAEVYAFSTFFIGIVTWLMMVWHEKADEHGSEKYLILIAYLLGLSTGVHLMAVLAIVSVVMVVMIRKYLTDDTIFMRTSYYFLGHAAGLFLIALAIWATQTDTAAPNPEQFKAVDQKFLLIFGGISIFFMAAMRKTIFQRNSFYIPIIFGGIALISVYPGIVKIIPNAISAIGQDNVIVSFGLFILLFVVSGYFIYFFKKRNKETFSLIFKCFLFALIGYTTLTMIPIRAEQDPPINLNDPSSMTKLVSYVNREQYGDFPTFKRRFSYESKHQEIYTNYSSDLDFFWRYQMNHMFNRYLLWNYAGRVSTVQDDGVDWGKLLGIPFFIGLFGVYFHFRKDWKMAWVFLVMFVFLGYLTAFYQNQQQPQPRERDYFYVGAYFVFSLWIAIGTRGIIDLIKESLNKPEFNKIINVAVLGLAFVFIPVKMFTVNYFEHDRTDDYLPWDSAYNMLQSVEEDAVLFTFGDNDTFPLWYLQDVEGVRTDVRIACLALCNTSWYTKQLKNNSPYGSKPVKMSLNDDELDRLAPVRWQDREIELEVPPQVFESFGVTDPEIIDQGKINWVMPASTQFGSVKVATVQDLVALDMIIANKWERPIYFASTTSEPSRIGLNDYLKLEGLAFRLVPAKNPSPDDYYLDPEKMSANMLESPETYSKEYQSGFLFRGLNDSTIFFDDNHGRLIGNYRNSFIRLALHHYTITKDDAKVIEILDTMERKIPRNVLKMDYRIKHDIAKIYFNVGGLDQYNEFAREVIETAHQMLDDNPRNFSSYYNPYQLLLTHYENLQEYGKAVDVLLQLQSFVPDDEGVKNLLLKYRQLAGQNKPEVVTPQ